MNKKFILTLSLLLTISSIAVNAEDKSGITQLPKVKPNNGNEEVQEAHSNIDPNYIDMSHISLNREIMYYPNATLKSAVGRYKTGNYVGCIQELFSLVKKEPNNPFAYYYMALAYTKIGMMDAAVAAYEQVINLHSDEYLVKVATKGRDCITDGPACHPEKLVVEEEEELDDLDRFIRAPYGNGLSPELNMEIREKQLKNIRETINKKEHLDPNDVDNIRKFDKKKQKSSIDNDMRIAQVSDEDVLNAVNTLKEAGLNVTVQSENPYNQMNTYQDPKMAEMSMLLGNNNNNNNGSMMNMMPMLMNQAQRGENVDPRFMQAMMMNSMMADFNFNNNDDK